MIEFWTGDIFAVKGSGPSGWASQNLLLPRTDRYHHGILGDYISREDDWVVLESIFKGPTVGRLSWYRGKDLEIYRPVGATPEDGRRAAAEATRWGRAPYDYLLIARLALAYLRFHLDDLPMRRPHYWELHYVEDSAFICTELAYRAWAWFEPPVIPRGPPLPQAFKDALDAGRLTLIWKGTDWREGGLRYMTMGDLLKRWEA